jgi:SPP1 gp7 family putative phage head morphogenesis protein
MRWVRAFWAMWRHVALNELEKANPDFAKRFEELLAVSGLDTALQKTGVAVTDLVARYMRSIFKRGTTPARVRLDATFGPDTTVPRLSPASNAEQQAQIDAWRKENLRLIKNASEEHVEDLAAVFKEAQENGLSRQELIDVVMQRLGVGESRAKLIASDQTTKFNGSVQAVQQQAAGITEFVWGTSRDGAVRPSHRVLEGKTFSWLAPPVVDGEVATPGTPIRCRCQAIPKIALFEGLD